MLPQLKQTAMQATGKHSERKELGNYYIFKGMYGKHKLKVEAQGGV